MLNVSTAVQHYLHFLIGQQQQKMLWFVQSSLCSRIECLSMDLSCNAVYPSYQHMIIKTGGNEEEACKCVCERWEQIDKQSRKLSEGMRMKPLSLLHAHTHTLHIEMKRMYKRLLQTRPDDVFLFIKQNNRWMCV